jgi:hypothetical protein
VRKDGGVLNRADLIGAWLRYYVSERHDRPDEDPDRWAVQEVMGLVLDDPDEAWNLMIDLVRSSATEWQLVAIGSGVLEDLLRVNPDRYMTALEESAATNRKLVTAAACTWLYNDPVRPRIDALLREYNQPRM